MSNITIVQGQVGLIDPQTEYVDSGWSINGTVATHGGCYPGTMTYIGTFKFTAGKSYNITYQVEEYISGSVNPSLGTSNGLSQSANGSFTDTLLCNNNTDSLAFYSDGSLSITVLKIVETTTQSKPSETFAFHEGSNQWVGSYPFVPETMIRFADRLFSFQNGQMWEHETNVLHGNFYGVQYPFDVYFIVNQDYRLDKLLYNLRLDAKGQWYAPDISVAPSNQFPNGMQSRISKTNFKQIDGKLWANILNDINDPNFANIADIPTRQVKALFNGRKLQGGWAVVHLQCSDMGNTVNISSVETYYTETYRGM